MWWEDLGADAQPGFPGSVSCTSLQSVGDPSAGSSSPEGLGPPRPHLALLHPSSPPSLRGVCVEVSPALPAPHGDSTPCPRNTPDSAALTATQMGPAWTHQTLVSCSCPKSLAGQPGAPVVSPHPEPCRLWGGKGHSSGVLRLLGSQRSGRGPVTWPSSTRGPGSAQKAEGLN